MSFWDNIEIRKLERPGYCHCCGKKVEKDDETIIKLTKQRGQDQYYLLCFDCLDKINKTIKDGKIINRW